MARGRWISPDFYDDTVLAQCSHSARLVFPALWQLSDRCGVFRWDLRQIRKHAFGYDDLTLDQVGSLLGELGERGFIMRAEHGGKEWGLVVNMRKRQAFHRDEKEVHRSVLDEAQWQHVSSTGPAPCSHVVSTVPIVLRSEIGDLRSESFTESKDRAGLAEKAHSEFEARSGLSLTAPSAPVSKPKRKRDMSPERQAKAKAIKAAYCSEYLTKYGKQPPWGAREWGQLYDLLGSWTPEDLQRLVPLFFVWRNDRAIRSGHQWGKGPDCFVLKAGELDADVQAPERRKAAAIAHDRQRNEDHNATTQDQAARVAEMVIAKHANRQDSRVEREADHAARGLLAPDQRPSVVAVDGQALAVHRPGARQGAGRRDDATDDANPWGPDPDDPGSDSQSDEAGDGLG